MDAVALYSLISGSVNREDASTDSMKSYSLDDQETMITGILWKTLSQQGTNKYLSGVYWLC